MIYFVFALIVVFNVELLCCLGKMVIQLLFLIKQHKITCWVNLWKFITDTENLQTNQCKAISYWAPHIYLCVTKKTGEKGEARQLLDEDKKFIFNMPPLLTN